MSILRKIVDMFKRKTIIIYGETKLGHTFPSYETYLKYKEQQQK